MIWLEKYENFVPVYNAASDKLKKVMVNALNFAKKNISNGFVNEFVIIEVQDYKCLAFMRNSFLPTLETKDEPVAPIDIDKYVIPFTEEKYFPMQEVFLQPKFRQ